MLLIITTKKIYNRNLYYALKSNSRMMYNIKTYFYPFIKIVLITVIVVEFAGFIFAKIGIIPSGSPAVISLFADKNYGVWHQRH